MQFIILFVTQQFWIINFAALECQLSHRSRILTDFLKECRKSKLLGGSGAYSPRKRFLEFQPPKVFWVIQTGYLLSAPFERFQFGKFFGLILLSLKDLTNIPVPAAVEHNYYNIIVTNFSVQRWPALCSNPKEPTKKCKPWTCWSWDSPLSITAVCRPLSKCSNWFWSTHYNRLFALVDHMINSR